MALTPKYVSDLLASSEAIQASLASIVERLNAIEEQNRVLSEQLQFPVLNRANPSQEIKTFLSQAFPEKSPQELKCYYKDFSPLALRACYMYSEQENNHCAYYKNLPSKGKVAMKKTCIDFLLEKHEDLSVLRECDMAWPIEFTVQNAWTE
ncbi:hypothetical protein A0J61_11308 [Choanephora cucurbitarum]|uniref:Uncharacterized protein n=1 Tax=Choanephora cucurbitarum TaxID=101091 RepID=A0A1C7MUY5_9FUNG|nr:hypothetical protein A0J61_11308 [Choanephora cucurbitarum]